MVETFNTPALVCRFITAHKIPKREILSLIYKDGKYVLFYYTTIQKEDKYR